MSSHFTVVDLQNLKEMVGPFKDIPGPEVSAGSKVMAWFFDEYSKYKGFSPQCVTGASDPTGSTLAQDRQEWRGVKYRLVIHGPDVWMGGVEHDHVWQGLCCTCVMQASGNTGAVV